MSDSWYRIGHTTYEDDRTGCTVVLFDQLVPAWVDVRGGAPGTRETDLLGPGRTVGQLNAILLTGGSAFGLAAADGVMRYLDEQGSGFPTGGGPVPIVAGAVIFDLPVGTPRRPTADDGYAACLNATGAGTDTGRVGVGTGATVAKLGGLRPRDGGLGVGSARIGDTDVVAIVALNAAGDVVDPATGALLSRDEDTSPTARPSRDALLSGAARAAEGENTTIGAVLIGEPVSQLTLVRAGIAAHDGLARCVVPAHTLVDGDTFFIAAPARSETEPGRVLALCSAVEVAVEQAITRLFQPAANPVA